MAASRNNSRDSDSDRDDVKIKCIPNRYKTIDTKLKRADSPNELRTTDADSSVSQWS